MSRNILTDLSKQLDEAREWRINAGLKWKSAQERQLETQLAAHRRIANENQELDRAAYIQPADNPDMRRRLRDAERADIDRMACCGAPKAGNEASKKYARRHHKQVDTRYVVPTCIPARQCSELYAAKYKPDVPSKAYTKERGPDRMPCCGAPNGGDETTDKFYLRHRNGSFGLIPGKPCVPAAKCRTLYNRILSKTRRR